MESSTILFAFRQTRYLDIYLSCFNSLLFVHFVSDYDIVEPPPPNMDSDFVRRKDRVSYAHQIVQVDLTQVMDPGKVSGSAYFFRIPAPCSFSRWDVSFFLDLTKWFISLSSSPNRIETKQKEPTHELEVEFRDSNSLLQAASTTRSNGPPQSQDWSPYEDMVLIFLNNVRLLIKWVFHLQIEAIKSSDGLNFFSLQKLSQHESRLNYHKSSFFLCLFPIYCTLSYPSKICNHQSLLPLWWSKSKTWEFREDTRSERYLGTSKRSGRLSRRRSESTH